MREQFAWRPNFFLGQINHRYCPNDQNTDCDTFLANVHLGVGTNVFICSVQSFKVEIKLSLPIVREFWLAAILQSPSQ